MADIDQSIARQRFNVAVARIMELVNATRKAMDGSAGPADPAVREAAEVVTIALDLVAPPLQEMWAGLGHAPSVANATWRRDRKLADNRVGDFCDFLQFKARYVPDCKYLRASARMSCAL